MGRHPGSEPRRVVYSGKVQPRVAEEADRIAADLDLTKSSYVNLALGLANFILSHAQAASLEDIASLDHPALAALAGAQPVEEQTQPI